MVAAFKGGSPDIDSSWSRVDKYAEELKTKWKLEMEPDIPTLCRKVDAILLESNDGRKHLPQAKLVIAAHKPMFIDKPLASTLEDAREIARLAREAGVPFFSSSSARFDGIATAMKFPDATGAIVWGPGPLEPHHHLDLSWYAIHPIELLYTLMGTGCEEVSRMATDDSDDIVGRWKDGRIGTVRANRPHGAQGAVVFRARQGGAERQHHEGRLRAVVEGDREILPDRDAAGRAGRDAGNHGVHGRRPTQQGSRRPADAPALKLRGFVEFENGYIIDPQQGSCSASSTGRVRS